MTTIHEYAGPSPIEHETYKELVECALGEGFHDGTTGDVQGPGWFGIVKHDAVHVHYQHQPDDESDEVVACIVQEDERGFKGYEEFGRESDADSRWDQIEEMVADWELGEDEEDEPVPPSVWCSIHEAPHEMASLACELRQSEDLLDRM